MITLVDCNNFYVSCERVFKPHLNCKPVVVLSNNDGCVISRSQEVKDLGIKMGAPYFKYKQFFKESGVSVFSSNYALYADLSSRVMETLASFTPDIEIYSIDEAFLRPVSGKDLYEYSRKIKDTVWLWTGMPVSVGTAKTKVLAKIANEIAKKNIEYKGVFDMSSLSGKDVNTLLDKFPVEDIWGVGRRYALRLKRKGVNTALELKRCDPRWARSEMTVLGERLVRELNGTPCIELEMAHKNKKEIACTRSFGEKVTSVNDLKEAVSSYAERAACKLRRQGSVCSGVYVFIMTSRFDDDKYYRSAFSAFQAPTASTSRILTEANIILRSIFRSGKRYAKAGVVLTGITDRRHREADLFTEGYYGSREEVLTSAIDKLNRKWGAKVISHASSGINNIWNMKRGLLSPAHLTSWDELAVVKA